ncbi:beta-glucoside-specific PTS transporter subunit IIABC [Clostridium nigeriense]|uniref:beta-glucoside-specific PTS transporter subunit IIABC n=1 Tax=Clostridium nigeriense TaxID=1805470 RepID=UPI003D32C06E
MSKKYESLAQNIVEKIGGIKNISNVYHCTTRLRFTLNDDNKADKNALEGMDGVAKVMISNEMFQVVIGTHVKEVYEEVEKIVQPQSLKSEPVSQKKKNPVGVFIDFISGTFMPVIPAMSGAGMIKAVLALLTVFNVISTDSQTYYVLNFFSDAIFYFLPIYLAFNAAQKLHCSPMLAAAVAGIMLHPNWTALVNAGEPVALFDVIPLTLVSYTSSVIPVILVIFIQSYVEKLLEKIIPNSIKLVFVPLLTFLIMGTLALSILGPIGSFIGNYLAMFFDFLSTNASWAPAVLIGGTLPVMVIFGVHTAVGPLGAMQMAQLGYDSIFGPGALCSNIAQATSSLVVAIRTKDKSMKQLATSGSITAYMGITEPALYGVNLPKKYPLIASMIGGASGGLYAGLTQTHRFATGSSGLPAVLLYIGDNTMTFLYNIIIALVITVIVTAIVTYLLSLRFEKSGKSQDKQTIEVNVMNESVTSPIQGEVKPLSESKDDAFSSKSLGDGVVIEPSNGEIRAPFDGKVSVLFPTKHAIGLVSKQGVELLIHVGIDTVNLNGEGFEAFVQQGQKVKKGDKLIYADLQKIKDTGLCTQIPVIVTNSADYQFIDTNTNIIADYSTTIIKISKGE